jgi:RHS repeat-associated protein
MRQLLKNAIILLALLLTGVSANLQRSNEQGLSPTHTYTADGGKDVISDLNGNLVFTDQAAGFSRPGGMGVVVDRTFNSHWRDPLVVNQYDLDFDRTGEKDCKAGRDKDTGECPFRQAKYNDFDPSTPGWKGNHVFGGTLFELSRYRVKDMGSSSKNMSMISGVLSINGSVLTAVDGLSAINPADFPNNTTNSAFLSNGAAVLQVAGLALSVQSIIANWENYGFDTWQQGGNTVATFTGAAVNVTRLAMTFNSLGSSAVGSAAANSTKAFGSVLSSIAIAVQVYQLATNIDDATALDFVGLGLNASLLVANLTGAAGAAFIPGLQFAAAVLAVYQIGKAVDAMIDENNARWDLGETRIRPWSYSVNGYLGLMGMKTHDRLSRLSKLGSFVDHIEYDTIPGDENSSESIIAINRRSSLHPMPELFLVRGDASASRFILSNRDSIIQTNVKDGSCPVNERKVRGYVGLSNSEKSEIVFIDCSPYGPVNNKQDTNDYYMIREPDGTWAQFGQGKTKGVLTDWAEGREYEEFWALPTQLGSAITHDTVSINRDATLKITSVTHNHDPRSVKFSSNSTQETVSLYDGNTQLVSTRYTTATHTYKDAHDKPEGQVTMVTEIAHQKSATEWLTTKISYADGNMVSVTRENGAKASYEFPATKVASVLDGHCLKKSVVSGKATEEWIYTYNGLGASGDGDLAPLQITIVKHTLTQPDLAGTMTTSSTQVANTYKLVFTGMNINSKADLYLDSIAGSDSSALKSIEYKSSRLQLLSTVEGIGGLGKNTFYSYIGDLRSSQGVATTLDARFTDPDFTTWAYDERGYPILEKRNPSFELSEFRKDAILRAAGVYSKVLSDSTYLSRIDTSEVGIAEFKRLAKNSLGYDFDTIPLRADDALTATQYWHLERNNFFNTSFDTTRTSGGIIDSIKPNRQPNDSFRTDGLYRLGTPLYKVYLRLTAPDVDSLASGVFGEISQVDTLLRVRERSLYASGITMLAETILYPEEVASPVAGLPTMVLSYRDSLGSWSATRFNYDTYGRQTSSKRYLEWDDSSNTGEYLKDSVAWNGLSQKIRECNPNGDCSNFSYDLLGRLTAEIRPDGTTRTIKFHDTPDASGYTGYTEHLPGGDSLNAYFDGLGRLRKVVRGGGGKTDTKESFYGIFGKMLQSRDGGGRQSMFEYDPIGRLRTVKVQKDSSNLWLRRDYTYNALMSTYTETDEDGIKTVFTHDKQGHDLKVDRGDYHVENRYDNMGNLVWSKDPQGMVSFHKYDIQNRHMQTRTPEGISEAYSYDMLHNLTSTTTTGPGGQDSLSRSVDAMGRELTRTATRNGVGIATMTNQWDARTGYRKLGSLVGYKANTDQQSLDVRYTYTNMSRLDSVHRQASFKQSAQVFSAYDAVLGYDYTPDGLVQSMRLPGGATMDWGFDGLRRTIRNGLEAGNDSVTFVKDVLRDASGLTSKLTMGNGTELKYTYESGRPLLKGVQAFRPNTGTPSWSLGLRYGSTGDIERMDRPSGERALYGYDQLHRLITVDYPTGTYGQGHNYRYAYTPNGNRAAFQHEFGTDTVMYGDGDNKPTQHVSDVTGTRRFGYDHKGNRSQTRTYARATDPDSAWTRSEQYAYDWDDKLTGYTRITKDKNGARDTIQRRYLLDERGWRIAELAPTASGWKSLRNSVYQGNYAIADSSEKGWTWYGRVGEQPIGHASLDTAGHLSGRWYLTDHLGSVTRVENDTGGIVQNISLDPYGNVESMNGSETVALTFTGKPRDGARDVVSFGARDLDTRMGMWMGRDKAGQFDSPYGFSTNPLTGVDKDGNFWWILQVLELLGVTATITDAPNQDMYCKLGQNGFEYRRIDQIPPAERSQWTYSVYGEPGATPMGLGPIPFMKGPTPKGASAGSKLPGLAETAKADVAATGKGAKSVASTGRSIAGNLKEQLAMTQAMADPTAGRVLPIVMNDSKNGWKASDGWVKMSQNINGVEVHYVRNTITTEVADFKFK